MRTCVFLQVWPSCRHVSYVIGLFGVLASEVGQYVAWGSGRNQMGESSEVLPAAGMMGDSLRLKI